MTPAGACCALAALAVGACSLSPTHPLARVRKGPAFARPPGRILALPARCAPETDEVCRHAYARAVEGAARMSLELDGYTLVDSELINLHMRRRRERLRENLAGLAALSPVVELSGGLTWADATEEERRALVRDLRVDGFLAADIAIGPMHGMNGQQTIQVRLSVTRVGGLERVWTSRCAIDTGTHVTLYHSVDQAVDRATRCALESVELFR